MQLLVANQGVLYGAFKRGKSYGLLTKTTSSGGGTKKGQHWLCFCSFRSIMVGTLHTLPS